MSAPLASTKPAASLAPPLPEPEPHHSLNPASPLPANPDPGHVPDAMSASISAAIPAAIPAVPVPFHEHGPIEAFASMLRSILVALFVLTFILQPMVIPSESMERTLLVGDFLIVNRIVLAPAKPWAWLLRYEPPMRSEIVTFHSPLNPSDYLVKRVIGLPGDRLRMENGRVWINGQQLPEPYAVFEPGEANPAMDRFPAALYTDPRVDAAWWRQMQSLTRNGDLLIPPGKYFMLGDNRNHSLDSRYWGFVDRSAMVARPEFIYFSLNRPSRTDLPNPPSTTPVRSGNGPAQSASPNAPNAPNAPNDRLGLDDSLRSRLQAFARWNRFFRVIR